MTKQSPRRSFFRRDDAENQTQTPSREASSREENQTEQRAPRAPRSTESEDRAPRATRTYEKREPRSSSEERAPRSARPYEKREPRFSSEERAPRSYEKREPRSSSDERTPREARSYERREPRSSSEERAPRENRPYERREPRSSSDERAPRENRPYERREPRSSSDERAPREARPYEKREPRSSSEDRAPRSYEKREPRTDRPTRFTSERSDRKPFTRHDGEESQDRKPFGGSFKKYEPRSQRDENSAYNPENRTFKTDRKDAEHKGERPRFSEKKELRPTYSHLAPAEKQSDPTVPVRLNRFIGMSGICSRREADELIMAGEVKVNGEVIDQLGSKVTPATDVVELNGQVLKGEKKVYIIMNKPKGYVTTTEDPHAERTVIDLLKGACKERVYPVGRLDKNTTGVLLLTNDGDLTKELTHPSYEKSKLYHVFLDKEATQDDLNQLSKGITLEDGEIKADDISFVEGNPAEVGVEIHSGRNRIVRRMFEHLGYDVVRLDRVHFAGMGKMGLRRGFWRYLTPREVATLKGKSYR